MRRLLLLILLFVLPLSYSNTLLIATTADNPPFNSIADAKTHFFGFDIDMVSAICKRIKYECRFTPIQFNKIFTAIMENKVDLASAGIIITPDRQNDFLFSIPYLVSAAQFMTKKSSGIDQPADLVHKKVGVRLGTPFKSLALSIYKNQVDVIEYPHTPKLLDALSNNKVDAVLMDAPAVRIWVANNGNLFKSVGSNIPLGKGYGIMANKVQDKLIDQINQALLDMEADGTYLQIYNNYFEH